MRRTTRALFVVNVWLLLTLPVIPAFGRVSESGYVSHQAIVRLAPGTDIKQFTKDYKSQVVSSIGSRDIYLLQLPTAMNEQTFNELVERDPRVTWADLNFEGEAPGGSTQSFFFNVPVQVYVSQYAWDQVNLNEAHKVTTGSGATVAILDTGIDAGHPALSGQVLPNGYNFVNQNANVADIGDGIDNDGDAQIDELTGHGTYLAGVIAFVAPDASLLPIKVLDSDGFGTAFAVAQGIFYAIDQGADVINLSMGTAYNSDVIAMALDEAHAVGVVLAAAAGNENTDFPVMFPAGHPKAMAVAATDANDLKASFSNFGDHITISAPGQDVVGAYPNGQYAEGDGTSASTALVSGAAALVRSLDPSASRIQVQQALMLSADDLDVFNPSYAGQLGAGRLNIGAAVNSIPIAPGDLNNDGRVNVTDLLMVISAWGSTNSPADLDGDGTVGTSDLLIVLSNWG